jgi:predicted dehydrogenase
VGSPLNIGIIGVGKISGQYLASLASLPGLRLVGVADLDQLRSRAVAEQHGVEAFSVSELLDDSRIDAVLNLTIPAVHADIDVSALAAGKHVYGEKPLALVPVDAMEVLKLAEERGMRVGSAPDTFLGTGIQTARAVLESGDIGTPVAASAFWGSPGHERWHPAPHFYYQPGGGPLFDMGPYYLTALVTLLGPVRRVSGVATRSRPERVVATGALAGTTIPVDIDTHTSAILEHSSGVTSTITMSFDIWASRVPCIEVYGTAGTIAVPDPNRFSEPVEVWTKNRGTWETVEPRAGYIGAGRGFGLADMARAIATDRPHRASAELAFHVLEIMDSIARAAASRAIVDVRSTVEAPSLVPLGVAPDTW